MLLFPFIVMSMALTLGAPSVSEWLATVFGIDYDLPIRDQAGGWTWFVAFIVSMSILILSTVLLGVLAQAVFCWTILRWSRDKVLAVYLRGDYPKEWENQGTARDSL